MSEVAEATGTQEKDGGPVIASTTGDDAAPPISETPVTIPPGMEAEYEEHDRGHFEGIRLAIRHGSGPAVGAEALRKALDMLPPGARVIVVDTRAIPLQPTGSEVERPRRGTVLVYPECSVLSRPPSHRAIAATLYFFA